MAKKKKDEGDKTRATGRFLRLPAVGACSCRSTARVGRTVERGLRALRRRAHLRVQREKGWGDERERAPSALPGGSYLSESDGRAGWRGAPVV